jgi:hypothetical protein
MGSLDYLATWIAWERDSEKRGQDAAASWKLANIQTWECTSMGYCDDLYTTLQALLAATQALECCGEQDITDGERYTDDVVDGEGDVPQPIIDAGYAEDSEDWAGFADYKCMISHLAVDHIEAFFRGMAPVFNDAGIAVGGVGVAIALLGSILALAGFPITFAIIGAVGAASAIWYWVAEYGEDAVDDIADEIAIHHDALACAIYNGDGVSDAISDFNDEVDSLFGAIDAAGIKAVGFEPQLRAMYSGRYNQQDIAEKLADQGYETIGYVCDCEEQDPPPEGYHLENAGSLSFYGGIGCTDTGSFVNPSTGIVTLDLNVTSETMWEHTVDITNGSPENKGWLRHGWVMDLISYDGLTVIPDFRGVNGSFPNPINIGAEIDPGDSWAGYNLNQHSGQDWVDWANQYDFVRPNNQGLGLVLQGSEFRGSTGYITLGAHLCVYRLRIVRPD